ncbi:hypothetical protein [Notoacmeibacter sp. MSK16QG-6]|uniref:hypothetical protein n=1 Tax=Notoacmeibacter sp. MSK16QG-6 TaxID=2957982 RepID=UPI00209FE15C|nr:hypothetical protein [Notoacmeibacter sp. MSK16QG-6]MCP1198641.1 hypothetical protein [Notoacmeibacter sp. MSK16QG-6]
MARNRKYFSRLVADTADVFAVAYKAQALASMSDADFHARGTTREKALRKLMDLS